MTAATEGEVIGDFECVYDNMPRFGLARATRFVPAVNPRESASGRMSLRP
jgi:hypothetical protein